MVRGNSGKVVDNGVAKMAHPKEVNQSSIEPGSHIRALSVVGPIKLVTSKVSVLETCLQHSRLESFKGGRGRLANTELISMGEGGIEVP